MCTRYRHMSAKEQRYNKNTGCIESDPMWTASLCRPGVLQWPNEPGRGEKLESKFYTALCLIPRELIKRTRGENKKGHIAGIPLSLLCWNYVLSVSVQLQHHALSNMDTSLLRGTHKQTAYKRFFTIKMKRFIQEVQIWWYQPSLKAITMRQRGHKPKSLAQDMWKRVSYEPPVNAVIPIIARKPPPLFGHSLDLRGTIRVFTTRPVSYFNKAVS